MTAKEYLSKLRNLDIMIKQKQYEADELKLLATSTGSISNQSDPVKTSKTGDSLERKVLKYVELENEINCDIDRLVDLRHIIIDQIHKLTESKHIELLFKRYVEFKKFEVIACEMNYDYDWIRTLHGRALEDFENNILLNEHTQTHISI